MDRYRNISLNTSSFSDPCFIPKPPLQPPVPQEVHDALFFFFMPGWLFNTGRRILSDMVLVMTYISLVTFGSIDGLHIY